MLSGCFNEKSTQNMTTKTDCTVQGDCLVFRTTNSIINFETNKLTVESLTSMNINSQKPIEKAWFSAVNMEMGTIPIILTQQGASAVYQTQIFFGLCSEPKMQWQLTIKYADSSVEMVTLDVYWPNTEQT